VPPPVKTIRIKDKPPRSRMNRTQHEYRMCILSGISRKDSMTLSFYYTKAGEMGQGRSDFQSGFAKNRAA